MGLTKPFRPFAVLSATFLLGLMLVLGSGCATDERSEEAPGPGGAPADYNR